MEIKINYNSNWSDEDFGKVAIKESKKHPKQYVLISGGSRSISLILSARKPQSLNADGVENTIANYGGFFKNGKIVQASKSMMNQLNYIPASR